ncbi:DUF4162 domain-containing protein [Amycolatopsis sp. cmx-11-32]|uniref:ATP-binding protein DrrA1-3 family domain-containing protein n=2 Tax=unclassified Amycolatopsis TaxID=2618356 RepID=UPI0039E5340A
MSPPPASIPTAGPACGSRYGSCGASYDITILLTTHYLDEADHMAERIVIVDRGEVIANGTADALKADLAGDWIHFTTADIDTARTAVTLVGQTAGVFEVATDGQRVSVRIADAEAALPAFLRLLDHDSITVTRANVQRPSLDDVFLGLTGRRLEESGDATEEPIGVTHA